MLEEVFDSIPEETPYRDLREKVAIAVIEAHVSAYNADDDLAHLDRARAFRERYLAETRAKYPDQDVTTAELRAAFETLDMAALEPESCLEPPLHPCLQPAPCLSPIEPKRGCGGDHDDPGIAAALLLPLGLRRRRDVLERLADTLPADVVTHLRATLDENDCEGG